MPPTFPTTNGLVAPYLALLPEASGQRDHSLREGFNGLRYAVKTGIPWRSMPNDLPPWAAVYQQAMRWLKAGSFAALAHDLRGLLRLAAVPAGADGGGAGQPDLALDAGKRAPGRL